MNNSGNKNQSQSTKFLSKLEVEEIVKKTRQQFNKNQENIKKIDEQINQIRLDVQSNFLEEYQYVKNILIDQMIAQFCNSLTQNCNVDEKIKTFNQQLNDAKHQISKIQEKYKNQIQIANQVYDENWNKIYLEFNAQEFFQFTYYNEKLKNYESGNKNKYLNQINLEPQQQDNVFQKYCLQIFNELYKDPNHGFQILSFELFNKNTENALNYAINKFQSMTQSQNQQYSENISSINFVQLKKKFLDQLYENWQEGMKDLEIDKLLNIQQHEQEIEQKIKFHATVKAFIELRSQFGQYYLFDEEYEMINNSEKIDEIISLPSVPTKLAEEFYKDILDQLQPNQQIEETKKALIYEFQKLDFIPKEPNQNNGKAIQFLFNHIRKNLADQNRSFQHLQDQQTEQTRFVESLSKELVKQSEQIKTSIRQQCGSCIIYNMREDQSLTNIRKLFKNHIKNEEEYQKVINEQDQKFKDIIHAGDQMSLDDQIKYLEERIDEFEKELLLEWLTKCWNMCKEELSQYQEIDENQLIQQFKELQNDIVKSINNKIIKLDQDLSLVNQFKQKWKENKWWETVINIFVEKYKE